jgi:MFS family permease
MLFFSSIIFGRLGDILGRKKLIIIGFAVSGLAFLGHNLIKDILTLFIFRGLAGIGVGIIPGSLTALAWGSPIGIFTALGSLGYTTGNFLAGALKQDSLIFSTSALFCLIGLSLTFLIKEKPKRIAVPLFPYKIVKKNLNVYLPFLIRHSAASAIWAIFPIYLEGLGASIFYIGLIYAINPFMQFIFMLIMDRFQVSKLIMFGLFASAITFLGYGISPNWQIIFFLQIILGFSWANLYLGSLKHLLANNVEQATAIGCLSSVIGLAGILGPLIGGTISFLGLRNLILFSSALAFFAFIISRILKPQVE